MKPTTNKPLIISLIKDDLINCSLVTNLNAIGLEAGNYFLHLGDTVFSLMGFAASVENDRVFEKYLQLTRKAQHQHVINEPEQLDKLAEEIYEELEKERGKSNRTEQEKD